MTNPNRASLAPWGELPLMATTTGPVNTAGAPQTRRRRATGAVAGAALTLGALLAGCASTAASPGPAAAGGVAPHTETTSGLPSPHVHGVAVNPGDGRVYLATHQGLFRYDDTGPQLIGPVIDLMGFTVAGPDRFYASGHPGPGTDLPEPVGLLESVDGGVRWAPLSRQGSSDFHTLTASTAGIVGFDGQLRASTDGKTWVDLAGVDAPWTLAAAPAGAAVLATSPEGLHRSTDTGRTWTSSPTAPPLAVVTWADDQIAVGVTATGQVHVSTDAGLTWQASGVTGQPQAVAATSTGGGDLRILVVTASQLLEATDGGHVFTALT